MVACEFTNCTNRCSKTWQTAPLSVGIWTFNPSELRDTAGNLAYSLPRWETMLPFVNQSLGTSLRPPDSLFPWHIQSITRSHRYHNICSYCSVPQGVHLCNPMTVACLASLSFTISESWLKPTESMMPSNHLILCHPLLLLSSTFPSIKVFSNEPALRVRWPKYWSFSFSISPSNKYLGLISFRTDWFDLLAV